MVPLVETLKQNNYLRSEELVSAFESVSRAEFLPQEFEDEADADIPLPIGHGQMGPQPSLVAVMLELLEIKEGHRVLVVGSGSGWVTGLIAYTVGHQGKVVAFERIEDLHLLGQRNLEKFDFIKSGRVECFLGEGQDEFQEDTPFDRILVLASVDGVPSSFRQRLVLSGKMVMPIRNHLCYFEKRSEDELYKEEFPGFFFVPLILKSF
ncbi:MAG: protein-L-isoaspartate(D-aspartate) O-methyltransferase [Patescibacteria group bacterium]|jgi:protein-L-isoaspartate(D-aspartate) O-methyltransferase|nr:protein-L-isoaspartate(D-aspartate) O-methyltransferase [Patescibacteria group bacterium]